MIVQLLNYFLQGQICYFQFIFLIFTSLYVLQAHSMLFYILLMTPYAKLPIFSHFVWYVPFFIHIALQGFVMIFGSHRTFRTCWIHTGSLIFYVDIIIFSLISQSLGFRWKNPRTLAPRWKDPAIKLKLT